MTPADEGIAAARADDRRARLEERAARRARQNELTEAALERDLEEREEREAEDLATKRNRRPLDARNPAWLAFVAVWDEIQHPSVKWIRGCKFSEGGTR